MCLDDQPYPKIEILESMEVAAHRVRITAFLQVYAEEGMSPV